MFYIIVYLCIIMLFKKLLKYYSIDKIFYSFLLFLSNESFLFTNSINNGESNLISYLYIENFIIFFLLRFYYLCIYFSFNFLKMEIKIERKKIKKIPIPNSFSKIASTIKLIISF